MNWLRVILFFWALILIAGTMGRASAEEDEHDHEEESSSKTHENEKTDDHDKHKEERELPAGVTSFNDETGEFNLSDEAIRNFDITTSQISSVNGVFKVPKNALVRSLKTVSLYFKADSGFVAHEVTLVASEGEYASVKPLKNTGLSVVVIKGMNFLKTIHLSLEEDPSEGHGH